MHDQNNIFYAIALSVVVLITWQYFFATSFLGKPSAPKNASTNAPIISQIGAPAPGTAIIGLQAQATRPQRCRARNRVSRSRASRRLRGRNVSPSIRPD